MFVTTGLRAIGNRRFRTNEELVQIVCADESSRQLTNYLQRFSIMCCLFQGFLEVIDNIIRIADSLIYVFKVAF